MSNTETIIKYLKLYNEWRRGDEKMGQPNPTEIGKLIDEACEMLTLLQCERDEAREALSDWENAALHVEADHPNEKHCGCVPVLRKLLTDARSELSLKQQTLTIAEGTLFDLRKELKEWAAMCGRYKQERDIAEQDATNYHARIIELIDERDKTKRERDEAREAFKIVYNERVQMELERNEWKNKAYSHATDYTLMEAKCFRLEQQLKEYDQLKS